MPTTSNVTKLKQPASEQSSKVRPIRKEIPDVNRIPDEAAIAQRAYEKFLARGGDHGQHREDWAAAEMELRTEMATAELGATQGLP